MKTEEQQQETPSYLALDILPNEPPISVESLTEHFPHKNLSTVFKEETQVVRTKTNVKSSVVKDKQPWSTSVVIIEEIRVAPGGASATQKSKTASAAKNNHLKRTKEGAQSANQSSTFVPTNSFVSFKSQCATWNKKASEQYKIFRVSESVGDCPAILFVRKDIKKDIVPGQVIVVQSPQVLKRKLKCEEHQLANKIAGLSNEDNEQQEPDDGIRQVKAQTVVSIAPIGLLVNLQDRVHLIGRASNFGICKHVTYGPEYEDKMAYDSLVSTNSASAKKPAVAKKFLADVLKCYSPVDTDVSKYCTHHVLKRSDDVCGSRLELCGTSFVKPIMSQQASLYTKPLVFLAPSDTEDIQVFIDPQINTKLHRRREMLIESQRRTTAKKLTKRNPAIVAAMLDNISSTGNNSRGAQLILEQNRKNCEQAIEKALVKTKGLSNLSREIASKIVQSSNNSFIPKLGRGIEQDKTITFDLSSSEDESSDEEPETLSKKRKL